MRTRRRRIEKWRKAVIGGEKTLWLGIHAAVDISTRE